MLGDNATELDVGAEWFLTMNLAGPKEPTSFWPRYFVRLIAKRKNAESTLNPRTPWNVENPDSSLVLGMTSLSTGYIC